MSTLSQGIGGFIRDLLGKGSTSNQGGKGKKPTKGVIYGEVSASARCRGELWGINSTCAGPAEKQWSGWAFGLSTG